MSQTTAVELFAMPVLEAPLPIWRLPAHERELAYSLHQDSARAQFVTGRLLLRALLAERTGLRGTDIDIAAPQGQAPHIPGSDWHFSLSHTAERCVLALARATPVGIDIERLRPFEDALQVARQFFHPQEHAWLASQGRESVSQAFLRLWVRKEAVVKASGLGLAMALDGWLVLPVTSEESALEVCDGNQQVWCVHDLATDAQHVCALATLPEVAHQALKWIDSARIA